MASQRASLARNTLHQAAITEEGICVVVNKREAILVVDGGSVGLGDGQTNSIGDTLTQGTCRDLDTSGVVGLGVTRSDAVDFLYAYLLVHQGPLSSQVSTHTRTKIYIPGTS